MKKLFFLGTIFCAQLCFSQTVQTEIITGPDNDPKYLEFKKKCYEIAPRNQSSVASMYFGYDETLKNYFVGNIIPAEVPKTEPNISKKDYVSKLNLWIASNKQFLKPEHKNALITE